MSLTPVLLLHGWGGSSASTFTANGWLETLGGVGRDVIGIDLPGHGIGGGAHDPAAYVDLAGALNAMLPAVRLDVIAYSLGGKIALELACRQPDRFGKLVIGGVGDNIFLPEQNGAAVADALDFGLVPDTAGPVRALVEYSRASQSDPHALAAVLRRKPNPVADEGRLGEIGGQILLVNGDADGLAHPDGKLRAALGPHAYEALAGVDHFQLPKNRQFQMLSAQFLEADEDQSAHNKSEIAATR